MKKIFFTLIFICIALTLMGQRVDSVDLQSQIQRLDLGMKIVQQNQLNYSLEKEILQESYKSTLDRINLTITIVLGIFVILGFLGLKDLNSIKTTYTEELSNIKNLHEDFKSKFKDFESTKIAYKEELDKILVENKDQTRKIKVLEFKEKIRGKIKNNENTEAMECCIVALGIEPDDLTLLNLKAKTHTRLGQLRDTVKTFEKIMSLDPKDESVMCNLAESYYLANEIEKGKRLIDQNKSLFEQKCKGKLLILFDILENYHLKGKEDLISNISSLIEKGNLDSKSKQIENWDLSDAIFSTYYNTDEEKGEILRNLLWYWDGQLSSKDLIKRLGLDESNFTNKQTDDSKIATTT